MDKVDITIIGAGVVGLAITASVTKKFKNVLLVEKHYSFGMETSSRSSEVIHAGVYYHKNSLKSKLCLEGNRMLYNLCSENNIPCRNSGKLIIATNETEASHLPMLLKMAENNGAAGVRIVDQDEIKRIEPNVFGIAALWCPSSGIVDSHALMQYFEAVSLSHGATIAYSVEVINIDKTTGGYVVGVRDKDGSNYSFETRLLVNASGLTSDKVSAMCGIDTERDGYRINYLKGSYFRVHHKLERFPKTLIYPIPPIPTMVGIHTCPDISGGMRLGPYCTWTNDIEYNVDEGYRDLFFKSTRGFLPFLTKEELNPDTSGILPRLENPGEPMKDFIIRLETDKGLDGFINLVGIESPGLTSSPAIGKMVTEMIEQI